MLLVPWTCTALSGLQLHVSATHLLPMKMNTVDEDILLISRTEFVKHHCNVIFNDNVKQHCILFDDLANSATVLSSAAKYLQEANTHFLLFFFVITCASYSLWSRALLLFQPDRMTECKITTTKALQFNKKNSPELYHDYIFHTYFFLSIWRHSVHDDIHLHCFIMCGCTHVTPLSLIEKITGSKLHMYNIFHSSLCFLLAVPLTFCSSLQVVTFGSGKPIVRVKIDVHH